MKRFFKLFLPLILIITTGFTDCSAYCADTGPNSTARYIGFNDQYLILQTRSALSYCTGTGSDEKKYEHHTFSFGIGVNDLLHKSYESNSKNSAPPLDTTTLTDQSFEIMESTFQQIIFKSSNHRFTLSRKSGGFYGALVEVIIESIEVDQNDPESVIYKEITRYEIDLYEYYG